MNGIDNFIKCDGIFSKKYSQNAEKFLTFKAAISLFLQRNLKNIVETGCQRQLVDWGAGNSSLIFSETLAQFPDKGDLYTIDNSLYYLSICEQAVKHTNKVRYCHSDSVKALELLNIEIGLLYLDSLDYEVYQQKESQFHQLNEIKTIYPKLHDKTVILLDDNFFPNGGKTLLSKQFLQEMGWICVLDHHQTLWIKE